MNEVPLIQNVKKNDINTSIIAIKKQLKQLIEAVGLIESPNAPDLSPYVKKTDITDVVEVGNTNPVTSNGVAIAIEESIAENIVDVVEDDNLKAVTSNAVARTIQRIKSYFTTEQPTGGVWIDGKTIYRKVVDCGNLPNATTKNIPHNITNLGQVVDIRGIAKRLSDDAFFPIPWVSTYSTFQYNYTIYITQTNVVVGTLTDRTNETAIAIIEYTKTTD